MRLFRRGARTGSSGRLPPVIWRKGSMSWANGDCVEIAQLVDGVIGVRDSTRPRGPVLELTEGGWTAFLGRVRAGRLPL